MLNTRIATLTPNALLSQSESATRWFSVRVSPISRFLKLFDRASTLAIDAIAASFTSREKSFQHSVLGSYYNKSIKAPNS